VAEPRIVRAGSWARSNGTLPHRAFRRPAAVAGNHNEAAGSSLAVHQMDYGAAAPLKLLATVLDGGE